MPDFLNPCMDREGHIIISTADYNKLFKEMTAMYRRDQKLNKTAAEDMARAYLDAHYIVSDTYEENLERGLIE